MLAALLVALPLQDWLASFLAAQRAEDPTAALERCLELAPAHATTAYHIAASHARAGRGTEALAWLERAVDWGYADDAVLAWDEDFAALREEQRFVDVVARAARVEVEARGPGAFWDPPGRAESLVANDGRRAFLPTPHGILLWDVEERGFVGLLDGHPRDDALALAPDGDVLVGVTGRARVQAWRVSDRTALWDVMLPLEIELRSLHFSGAGTRVVLRGARRVLHLSLESGQIVSHELEISNTARFEAGGGAWKEVDFPASRRVRSRAPTPVDDERVAVLSGQGTLSLVEVDSASLLERRRLDAVWDLEPCGEWFVADGRRRAHVLDPRTLERVWVVPGGRVQASAETPRLFVVSDGSARIHDVARRSSTPAFEVAGRLECAAWSADGAHVAVAVGDTVTVWDAESGTPTSERYGHPGRTVVAIAFSPDGETLATGSVYSGPLEREVLVHAWNRESGSQRWAVVATGPWAGYVQRLRHVEGGERLVVVLGGLPEVELRDAETLDVLWRHDEFGGGPNWVRLVETEPGWLWVSGDYDCRVLDLSTGVARRRFDDDVSALVPGVDGRRVFTVRDGALEIRGGDSLDVLVTRVEYAEDGELVHLPSGWFRGTEEALANTWVMADGEVRRLVDRAPESYDPVRVAAGAAGVRVRPPATR